MRKKVDIVLKEDTRAERKFDNVYHQIMSTGPSSFFVAESNGCTGVPMIVYVVDPTMPIEINCWAIECFKGRDGKYNYGRVFNVLELYAEKMSGRDIIMAGDKEESIILDGCVRIIGTDKYQYDFPKKIPNVSYKFKLDFCKENKYEAYVDIVTKFDATFGGKMPIGGYDPFINKEGEIVLHDEYDESLITKVKNYIEEYKKPMWSDRAMGYLQELDENKFVPYPFNVLKAYDQGFEDSTVINKI